MSIKIAVVRLKRKLLNPYYRVVNSLTVPAKKNWDEPIKINLGCGGNYISNWVNIDADSSQRVDLLIDFRDVRKYFKKDSVTEIFMNHSISYLSLWEAKILMTDLYQLMKPGGKIVFEFPDVLKCAHAIVNSDHDITRYLESVRPFYAFDMNQIEKKQSYIPYSFGWTSWHLEEELRKIGFSDIKILNPQTHGERNWRDSRVEASK